MRLRTAGAAAATALLLTACGSDSDDGAFVTGDETGYPVQCMDHQPDKPGKAYTGGEDAETTAVLKMLRYYTANKAVQAFCDGKGPNGNDRRWAQLYVDLGAEPSNVARLLA